MARLETGVVQADGDWPGVFIRGDEAAQVAIMCRHLAAVRELRHLEKKLMQLADLMDSPNVNALGFSSRDVQKVKL